MANGPGNAGVAFVPAMSNKVDCHRGVRRIEQCRPAVRILHAYLQREVRVCTSVAVQSMHSQFLLPASIVTVKILFVHCIFYGVLGYFSYVKCKRRDLRKAIHTEAKVY